MKKKLIISIFALLFGSIIVFNLVYNYKYSKNFINLYTIVSPSMKTNYNVYDLVFEIRVSEDKLKVGDVITYNSDNKSITHRIVRINNNKFYTQGDNNLYQDAIGVDYSNINGKVIFKIPYIGKLLFFASSKIGWLCLIFIPCMLIIVIELYKIKKICNEVKS